MSHGFRRGESGTERDMLESGIGRGRFVCDDPYTPVAGKDSANRTSPEVCSTQVAELIPSQIKRNSSSDTSDFSNTEWCNLITHIVQEVGYTMMSAQNRVGCGERENSDARTRSLGAGQSFSDTPSLNLTGVKLVI